MELSLQCCLYEDIVCKRCILLHKAVATYCESICHYSLDVSLKLRRFQVVCKETWNFLQKTHTHTHTTFHIQTPTRHTFILSLKGFVTVRTRNQYAFPKEMLLYFYRNTIKYVDNKRFDCLHKSSTHLKLCQFIDHALHSCALIVCISDTLVNWFSGALTFLYLVCQYTLCQSLLWQCRSTLVCAFIGFGQQMACRGWFCVHLGNMQAWLCLYYLIPAVSV